MAYPRIPGMPAGGSGDPPQGHGQPSSDPLGGMEQAKGRGEGHKDVPPPSKTRRAC